MFGDIMSKLGDYVHLNWENYQKYGTQKSDGQPKNYDIASVFAKYESQIKQRADKLQIHDLQKLEREYNKKRNYVLNSISKMQGFDKDLIHNFYTKVIENADIGVDEKDLDDIANMIIYDEKTKNLKLIINNILLKDGKIQKFPLEKLDDANSYSKKYIRASTIENRILKVKDVINSLPNSKLRINVEKSFNSFIDKYKKESEEFFTGLESLKFPLEKAKEIVKDKTSNRFSERGNRQIPVGLANDITKSLNSILDIFSVLNQIGKIQASFSEMIGTALKDMPTEIVIEEIFNGLTGALGGQKTSTHFEAKNAIIDLDQNQMKALFNKQKKSGKQFQIIQEKILDNGKIFYEFKLDYATKGKADFVLNYGEESIGVSAKTYNMRDFKVPFENEDKVIDSHITIHSGTSLINIFAGIEEEYNTMGNHFLNIFASHLDSKNNGDFSGARQAAENALKVSLLYSGLTGEILGKNDGFAKLLLIEDKSNKGKIKFYNIKHIISKVLKAEQNGVENASIITPNLNRLELINDSNVTTLERISMLLTQARTTKIYVGIRNVIF